MLQITNQNFRKLALPYSFKRLDLYLILFFSFIGFLISVTHVLGESPDYSQYDYFLDLVRSEGLYILSSSRFEPMFSILSLGLTAIISSNVLVYSFIVAAAMFLKGSVIKKVTTSNKIFLIVALFYLIRYFPLHELTQLRVACAIALVLVGAKLLWSGRLLFGILICVLSVAFHMSAAAIIPALFVNTTKRWQVLFIAFSVFILITFFSGMLQSYLANVILVFQGYQTAGFGESKPNPFAIQLLIDLVMIAFSLVVWRRLSLIMKRIVFLELIGMAVFYGAIEFAVIAHRVREFYSVFWVFFVADGLQHKTLKLETYGFVFISIIFYLYIFIIAGSFFH